MKKFLDKILDMPKLIKTIWIMLWIILVILLIFKFCFGMWYPIVIKNESFKNLCAYIDNTKWLSMSIMLFFYILNSFLLFFTMTGTKKYNKWYLYLICLGIFVGMFFLKSIHNSLGMICEILIIVVAIIINCKTKRFKNNKYNILVPIIFYLIINVWQLSIYLIRGLNVDELKLFPFLISLTLQLDYYIFLIITWIGVSYMSLFGWGWLWSKDVTVLRAEKEKELAKKEPDMDLVNEIDDRIAELEKEGK